jgi:serine/threonine-protein kinase
MIEPGQTVGNYTVKAKIGEGGMGAVFLAEHPVIGRKAALKVIHPQHARNAEVVSRFVTEATAINRIGHEHIVEVTDFGRTDAGDFYFIMEYLEGQPLSEVIERAAPLPPSQALGIAAQIADALAASHEHGVIHRDLKPENIFLVSRGEDPAFVKVLDFGLAKLLHTDGAAPRNTRDGMVMGTPFYMAPEQCEGTAEVDERADVYALGVLLFELLTGKVPFGGNRYADVLMKHMTMRPPSVRSLVPEVPPEVDAIVQRALSKDPAQRYPSMTAFREALLEPSSHAAAPSVSIHDDLSERMRWARPMSRAETLLGRKAAPAVGPTTFEQGTGEVHSRETPLRVPRHRGSSFAIVGLAALALLAVSAGLTFGWTTRSAALGAPAPAPPKTVAVTFSSEPAGATVTDAAGVELGTTPLSIQVDRGDQPAAYVFRKPGFQPKAMAVVPNVASSVFAAMQAERSREVADTATHADELRPDDDPPLRAAEPRARRTAGAKAAVRVRADADTDGVLPPSFVR